MVDVLNNLFNDLQCRECICKASELKAKELEINDLCAHVHELVNLIVNCTCATVKESATIATQTDIAIVDNSDSADQNNSSPNPLSMTPNVSTPFWIHPDIYSPKHNKGHDTQ